jgi:hypothetical protein
MKKIGHFIIAIMATFILLSCSSSPPAQAEPVLKKVGMEALPCWLYQLPEEGDYVIGIAPRNFDRESMQDAARQMAAVMHSRNAGSFTINKFARTSGSDQLKEGTGRFRLNVAEPETTQKIYNRLNLIDETYLYDNYIALFSLISNEIDESYCQKQVINFPEWFKKDDIIISDDVILSHSFESSHDLTTAWEKAAEKARLQLAKYLEKDVQSYVVSQDEKIEKQIAIESTRKLLNMNIFRSFILMKNFDSLISYEVYLEMRMEKP